MIPLLPSNAGRTCGGRASRRGAVDSAIPMAGRFEPPIFSFSSRRKRENGPFTVQKRKRRPCGGVSSPVESYCAYQRKRRRPHGFGVPLLPLSLVRRLLGVGAAFSAAAEPLCVGGLLLIFTAIRSIHLRKIRKNQAVEKAPLLFRQPDCFLMPLLRTLRRESHCSPYRSEFHPCRGHGRSESSGQTMLPESANRYGSAWSHCRP